MMSSNINTENVNASIETPLLNANLSSSILVGSMNTNTLTGVSNANTLEGAIGSAVIGGGIKSIYVNNHEQSVSNDIAYITLTYDMIYNLPTIPTKLSELENDEGFINSGYASEDDFTALSNQVGLMDNNLSSLNNEVDSISSDIDTINETLTNKVNQTDFNNLQTQVTTNTNNISANTRNIQANTTNITTLTNIVDAQSATITSMTALIEDNSDDIETLQTDVSSINTTLSNKVDTSTFNVLDAQVQTNTTAIANKQDTLVSGTNIKTINSQSLLGSGDITITGGQATDVQINGTSITSNNTANIETNSTYNASTNKIATMNDLPSVPTKTSDLTNDSGFITNTVNDLTNYTLTSNLATVATTGDYSDLSNKPTIPTATSQLTNDSGYVTNTDYASASTGGVVKTGSYGFNIGGLGVPYPSTVTYANYPSLPDYYFIGKGTLENVLTGKGLTDSGWQNITLASGVSAGAIGGTTYTPQCRKINGIVYLKGCISFTAQSTAKQVGTVPTGYRPDTLVYKLACTGGVRYARLIVSSGGAITVDWIYNANGTQVTSGSITWLELNISYIAS